jgi:hypothetical protein
LDGVKEKLEKLNRGEAIDRAHSNLDGGEINDRPADKDVSEVSLQGHEPDEIDPTLIDQDELLEEVTEQSGRYNENSVFEVSQSFEVFQDAEDLRFFEDLMEGLFYEEKQRDELFSELDEQYEGAEQRLEGLRNAGHLDQHNRPMTKATKAYNLAQRLEKFHMEEMAEEVNSRAQGVLDDVGSEVGYESLSERYDSLPGEEFETYAKQRAAETLDRIPKRIYKQEPENKLQVLMEARRANRAGAEDVLEETSYENSSHVATVVDDMGSDGLIERRSDDTYRLTEKGEVVADAAAEMYGIEATLANWSSATTGG